MDYRILVERFGSPLYVYHADRLASMYSKLVGYLPKNSQLYYSLKANPHPQIVRHLLSAGAKCEVSSIDELKSALLAGAEVDEILFTGPVKSTREIDFFLSHSVTFFSCESICDLEKILFQATKYNQKVRIIIRVNPNNKKLRSSLSMSGVSSQFGIDEEKILLIPSHLLNNALIDILGFHIFNGTNSNDAQSLIDSFTYSIRLAKRLSNNLGINLRFLDLGGGFGHPYAKFGESPNFSEIKEAITVVLDNELPGWKDQRPNIAFESGRYLVANCGEYVCKVEDVKESKGKNFVLLDGGINHLGGMSGLGRIQKHDFEFHSLNRNYNYEYNANFSATIVGPLCTPLDIFRRESQSTTMEIGDLLIIPNVGAYGLTASLISFLSKELPVEVVLNNNLVSHASRLNLAREIISESLTVHEN